MTTKLIEAKGPRYELWRNGYVWGDELEKRYPGQDAEDFACAVMHNPPHPFGDEFPVIQDFVCEEHGENDGGDWRWKITLESGAVWEAVGGCDYTGWDCQSYLDWTPLS